MLVRRRKLGGGRARKVGRMKSRRRRRTGKRPESGQNNEGGKKEEGGMRMEGQIGGRRERDQARTLRKNVIGIIVNMGEEVPRDEWCGSSLDYLVSAHMSKPGRKLTSLLELFANEIC